MPYDEVEVTRSRVKPMNKQVGFLEDGQMIKMFCAGPHYPSIRWSLSWKWTLPVQITAGAKVNRWGQVIYKVKVVKTSKKFPHQIALNVDGPPGREERTRAFQSNVMDKQTLIGSSAVDKTGRYAVGILNDNELHLTQLEGVLSLRPSLGYLDKSDLRSKTSVPDPDAEAPDIKPEAVTVKFARGDPSSSSWSWSSWSWSSSGDPEKNKKYKERSFEYQQKLQDEEAWVETDFKQMHGSTWDAESQKMFCGAMENTVAPMERSPDDYLLSLKDGQGSWPGQLYCDFWQN